MSYEWPLKSFDSRDWAKAFLQEYEKSPDGFICEATMVHWFGGAFVRAYEECGKDWLSRRTAAYRGDQR